MYVKMASTSTAGSRATSYTELRTLDEVYRRGRRATPVMVFLVLVMGAIAGRELRESRLVLGTWLAVLAMAVVRTAIFLQSARVRPRLTYRADLRLTAGAAVALSLLFAALNVSVANELDAVRLALWFLAVSGILSGAVASLGGSPVVYACYAVPNLGSIVLLPVYSDRAGGMAFSLLMGTLGVFLAAQVADTARTWRERIEIARALEEKVKELDGKNKQLVDAQAEARRQNEALAAKNDELVRLHERADRIFSALANALPGRSIDGKYRLGDRIGTGGFAVVFRAEQLARNRSVAVKVFRPQAGNDSSLALERFTREGAAMSRLSHPNIVEVLDAGVSSDGLAFIAMELLDGETLETLLEREERLDEERVAALAREVSGALVAAHSAGIVHRDIKPANIFLARTPAGTAVKLLDFGIARVREEIVGEGSSMTRSGILLGSPAFMAPEYHFNREYDERVDIYSLGVVLYRALSGRLPFDGTVPEIVDASLRGTAPALRTLVSGVRPDVAHMIHRMILPLPADRPDADAVARFFSDLVSRSPVAESAE